jgi:hypothetical protein
VSILRCSFVATRIPPDSFRAAARYHVLGRNAVKHLSVINAIARLADKSARTRQVRHDLAIYQGFTAERALTEDLSSGHDHQYRT